MSGGVTSQAAAVIDQREHQSSERLVDMRIIWREWGDPRRLTPDPDAPIILEAGGRWDRKAQEWVGDGDDCLTLHFQPAQYDIAYWFAEWLSAYLGVTAHSRRTDRKWTVMAAGARRSGKTDACVKMLLTLCAVRPDTIVWACSPTEDETIELHDVFSNLIPLEWAEYREAKLRWYFPNGSKIEYRSGYKAKSLKRGRVDIPFFNEAQYFPLGAYNMVRGAIADRGGFVLLACNPPNETIGQWVMDMHDSLQAGKETGCMFRLDPTLNPTVTQQALDDMREDLGEDDYRRDGLGEFIPIGDLVWYSWSPRYNVRPPGEIEDRRRGVDPIPLQDITCAWTKRMFGREFDSVIGMDFQLNPHMAAVACKFFRSPWDPEDAILWAVETWVIQGDETELADAILEGYDPKRTGLVIDASAWWQDAERTKGGGSCDLLVDAGFRYVYRPDQQAKSNPRIAERVKATNARMKNDLGQRRIFSSPENLELNRALKMWENRNGIPNRRSEFAHISDAISYVVWHMWPRKAERKRLVHEKVDRTRSAREREFDGF